MEKDYDVTNFLHNTSDDVFIINNLHHILNVCKDMGELHSRRVLFTKGIKIKQQRLGFMLKV